MYVYIYIYIHIYIYIYTHTYVSFTIWCFRAQGFRLFRVLRFDQMFVKDPRLNTQCIAITTRTNKDPRHQGGPEKEVI